jgi:hypothetical protein
VTANAAKLKRAAFAVTRLRDSLRRVFCHWNRA